MQRQNNPFLSPQPPRELHAATKEQKAFQHLTYFQSTQLICPAVPLYSQQSHQIPPYLQQMSMVNTTSNTITVVSPPKQKARSHDSLATQTSQILTHNAFMVPLIPIGSEHEVFVSHIEDGPGLFHVQLKEREPDLMNLMEQLKTIRLEVLDRRAQTCQPVIARYSMDKQLYRAVIVSVKPHACEVFYVDYGNTEVLRCDNIYKIPDSFLGPQVFAISFALANHRSLGSTLNDDVKQKFRQLVDTNSLRLKVTPSQDPPLFQWCDLYDGGKSVLEALLQFQNMKNCHFMPPMSLNVGDQERVFVCYIHTPKQFYVQLAKYDSSFEKIIDNLERELSELTNNTPSEDTLKPGLAVAAMYEDNSWYRGQIHQVLKDNVIVQFIDFGNYEKISFENLRYMPSQKYMELPPQAVLCCLKSFENEEKDSDATRTQFELMVQNSDNQRKIMKLHVLGKIRDSILLVELFDESLTPPLNVNKRILKLSMPQNKYNSIQNTPIINSTVNSQSQSAVWEANSSLGDSNMDSGKNSASPSTSRHCSDRIEPVLNPFSTQIVVSKPQINSKASVKISCWYSPHEFMVQMENRIKDYDQMMRRLQVVYSNGVSKGNCKPAVGNYMVAKNRKDNLWYRAKLIDYNPQLKKYRLEFVDVGNRQVLCEDEIYPIVDEFINFPIMAIKISLKNIVSVGDWTDLSNNLNRYISPQKKVVCEFLKEDESERFFANVQIDDVDLKTSLVADNFVADFSEDYDLKFLVGQTVLLHIVSVKSLLHSFAKLDGCKIAWPCSYFNANKAKEIELSFNFKSYQNKACAAKIEDVTQSNILCFSLSILDDFVEPVYCAIPCLSSEDEVVVVHVEKSNVIFVRPTIWEDPTNQLLNDMYEFYEKGGTALDAIPQKGIVACQSIVDDNFYRCTIGKTIDSQHVEVTYIDYGNSEVVPKKNLRVLETRFKTSALILRVILPYTLMSGVPEKDVINEITQQTADVVMKLSLIEPYRESCWIGNISCKGVAVDQILSDTGKIKKISIQEVKLEIDTLLDVHYNKNKAIDTTEESQSTTQTPSNSTLDNSILDLDKLEAGVLCHVVDPENFYIYLKEDVEAVEELTTNLQIVAPSLPNLDHFEVGSLCITRYELHEKWYRARIIGLEPDMLTLYYIDHGFFDCLLDLEAAKSLLKVYREVSPRAEGFAIKCALVVKPLHQDWPDDASAVLKEFLHKDVFFDRISSLCGEPPQKHFIKMYCNNTNMTQCLVDKKIAIPYRPVKSYAQCFVSHIDSLSKFYIQFDEDSVNLEILASYTMDAETDTTEFPALETIDLNKTYIARFPEDNRWYRAKILSENEDGSVNVFFVDYGNTYTSLPKKEVKNLKPVFDDIPAYAVKCSLMMPHNILQWSDAAEQLFRELAEEGSIVFTVQLILSFEWDSPNIVTLWQNDVNIVDQLQNLCEKTVSTFEKALNSFENLKQNANECAFQGAVFAILYNSPTSFYLQYQASSDLLCEIGNLLHHPDMQDYASPPADELCAALFEEDSVLYRARILEVTEGGRKVFFIDFGNVAICNKFKKLPEALKNLRPIVFHCQFEAGETLNQEENDKIEDALFEGDAIFDLEIIDDSVEPKIVKLFKNEIDLFQKLGIETEKKVTNGTNTEASGMPPKNKYKSTEVLKELKRSKK